MKKMFLKFVFVMCAVTLSGFVFSSCSKDDNGGGSDNGKTDPSTIAASNLVAYFPFDGNGNDVKGRTVTPKNVTASDFVTGRRGQAYQGKEGSGFIYALSTGDRIAKAKGLTFAMWIKTPAPVGGSPALFQINGTTTDWDVPGSFTLQFQDATQLVDSVGFKMYQFNTATEWTGQWSNLFSTPDFPANTWFHFVAMYDESTSSYKAYSNGKLVWSEVHFAGPVPDGGGDQPLLGNMSLPADANKLYVGAWWKLLEGQTADDWAQYFVGTLDEVRIYDRGLTDAEVAALFAAEVTQLN